MTKQFALALTVSAILATALVGCTGGDKTEEPVPAKPVATAPKDDVKPEAVKETTTPPSTPAPVSATTTPGKDTGGVKKD